MMTGRKIAVVTGGRRGIGGAIGVALAGAGFDIVVADVARDAAAEATLSAVEAKGRGAAFVAADVSDIGQHAGLLDAAESGGGALCCLVNNAGVSSIARGDMLELSPESYDRCMDVNLRGAFFLSQAFARRLIAAARETPEGACRSIINITSANAELLALERADYTISKAGMSMMTRLLAARLARHRINVYEIRPGLIATDMVAPSRARYDRMIEAGGVPIARWGEPEDVGRAAAMLASGGLPYTTGDAIRVDGGVGLHIWP